MHYCSSDLYIGEKEHSLQDSIQDSIQNSILHFNGKRILREIVKQIVSFYPQIEKASRITLGGGSAGSVGT